MLAWKLSYFNSFPFLQITDELNVTAYVIENSILEKSSFTLVCIINLPEDNVTVEWFKGITPIPGTMSDDYTVDDDPEVGVYSIIDNYAEAGDTGDYHCRCLQHPLMEKPNSTISDIISIHVLGMFLSHSLFPSIVCSALWCSSYFMYVCKRECVSLWDFDLLVELNGQNRLCINVVLPFLFCRWITCKK